MGICKYDVIRVFDNVALVGFDYVAVGYIMGTFSDCNLRLVLDIRVRVEGGRKDPIINSILDLMHKYPVVGEVEFMTFLVSKQVILAMNLTILTLGVLSTILNTLLLYIFFKVNNKSLSHTLIGVIAVMDLVAGICEGSMCAFSLAFGDGMFLNTWWFCNGLGMAIVFFTCLSSYFIGLLSAERYFRVSRYEGISRRTASALTAAVVAPLVITSTGTSLNSGYKPDPLLVYCLPLDTNWAVAMFSVAKIILTAPLPVLVASYVGIFIHCSKRIRNFPFLPKLLRMVLFLSVYCACFIPSTILMWCDFFSTFEKCPTFILISAPIVLSTLPVANPFLVMLLHQKMAAAFSRFFSDSPEFKPQIEQ